FFPFCFPGYHKVGPCEGKAEGYRCEKCGDGTYTAIENSVGECRRCKSCEYDEFEANPCTFSSNTLCEDCKCEQCEGPNNNRECKSCKSEQCLQFPECKRICKNVKPIPNRSSITTATTTATTTASTTSLSNDAPNPVKEFQWLLLTGVLVPFLGLLWFVLFIKNPFKCLCWRAKNELVPPVEDAILNEQGSHQGTSPDTLTLHISEETPMMTLSQSAATPEHPAHIRPLLPDGEHKVIKQIEQTEHWPAIVLYAIIKEVPLRRWKEFLRLLSVADQQIERVELEAGLGMGSMEKQYQILRLWSQRSSGCLNDVFSALHYMDLSGCAQLLQENLDKLQWKP
ncbi:tumor necrosis factor receptor superfamily member 1A, partial [Notothenia coriiceps]|uniref:Tumor necrosis factor receptor superfamily member 1A n=1 Tax=Notothenia coriiceps TaxID=8208 RepID=A0A6I9P4I6_9TELE